MFYVFDQTVLAAHTSSNKQRLDLPLTVGVIHQVDVLFQDGCDHEAHVQIFQADFQCWPSNRGNTLRANATAVSFREYYELGPGGTDLHALIWGDGTIDDVEVIIQIGLLPKRIIQPMSFDELLAAAAGIE